MAVASPSEAIRRSTRDEPREKTGYRLRQSVVEGVREAVKAGAAKSQNEFVERALVRELKARRRERLYDAYAEASADPAFNRDMEAVTAAFGPTTADGLDRAGS